MCMNILVLKYYDIIWDSKYLYNMSIPIYYFCAINNIIGNYWLYSKSWIISDILITTMIRIHINVKIFWKKYNTNINIFIEFEVY